MTKKCHLGIGFAFILAGNCLLYAAENPAREFKTSGFTPGVRTSVTVSMATCVSFVDKDSTVRWDGTIHYRLRCLSEVCTSEAFVREVGSSWGKHPEFKCGKCDATGKIIIQLLCDQTETCAVDTNAVEDTQGCEAQGIPFLGAWGVIVLLLLLATTAWFVLSRRRVRTTGATA